MANLIAQSATGTVLPIEIGEAILEDAQPEAITWIAGAKDMPGPNQTKETPEGRAIWIGPDQALILGAPAHPKTPHADQSDGFTVVRLTGATATDILARLTSIDLRDTAFPENATARTYLAHMTASITRTGPHSFEIMVFRSMTQTLIHDLTRAMSQVAARANL